MTHTRQRWIVFAAGATLAVAVSIATSASMLRSNFTETNFATGFASPTAMAFAPDGRLFVCQQGGQLRVVDPSGGLLATPFLTVTVNSSGERGLLGVAFDPTFETAPAGQKYIYVYYTATTPALHNRVSRFTQDPNNPNVAQANSELILLELNNLSTATNHNGGAMHFGPDGKLYVAVGDNANRDNARLLTNLLGKMLRINKDGSIPADNPFVSQADGVNEAIWAIGLRNPFTFSFDPDDGRMFINDVGENSWEEINVGQAGANYGWPDTEGSTNNPLFKSPLYAYPHGSGELRGCAITGGTFYRDVNFPAEYAGDYFFADFCNAWIAQLDSNGAIIGSFATSVAPSPVDLTVGPDGALYYLARGNGGVVQRIAFTGPQAPQIQVHPQNRTVAVGQTATFSVTASGSSPLSYQWQKNGANIAGATSSTYTTPPVVAGDSGSAFRCVVTNPIDSVTSNPGILTVSGNQAPTPTILTPAQGTTYAAGTAINFSGSATDPEDGTVPASRFTWQVDFHHDNHTHPHMPATSGATSGLFTIPDVGELATNVWYRIHLTVTDSAGVSVETTRDVTPRIVTITLQTSPPGLSVMLDGPVQTPSPVTFNSVVGMRRSIGTVSPQSRQSGSYEFRSWSDGGALTHTIVTPSVPTTFSAAFRKTRR